MLIAQLEDDFQQAAWTRALLESAFHDLRFLQFGSSYQFLSALSQLESQGLSLVITDAIMIWHPYLDRSGWLPEQGGIRLIETMRSTPGLEDVPVVFWTVFSESQLSIQKLPTRSIVVSKANQPAHLVRVIRSFLIAAGTPPKMKDTVISGLSDSLELKPGGFGISLDLKKLFSALMKRG